MVIMTVMDAGDGRSIVKMMVIQRRMCDDGDGDNDVDGGAMVIMMGQNCDADNDYDDEGAIEKMDGMEGKW